jgi:hypothetical protein
MFTKTALVAAVIFGTASVALANEADPNLLNRYPSHNGTTQAAPAFTSRNVGLSGNVIVRDESYMDRASQSFSGGY